MEIDMKNREVFKILQIGTGATGSQLLPYLTQLLNNYSLDHQLVLIDGDKFETKNLKNQKCTIYDIEHSKAKVLCERYRLVYPEINISYIDEYALNADMIIEEFLKDKSAFPIIISCVDNNASRKLFNEVFYDKRIPELIYVDSGNGTIDRTGQVVVGYKASKRVQSQEALPYFAMEDESYMVLEPAAKVFKAILEDNDTLDKLTSCTQEVDEHPQNIATNVMAASTVFSIMNEIIAFKNINTHIAYFDAENTTIDARPVKFNTVQQAFIPKRKMA